MYLGTSRPSLVGAHNASATEGLLYSTGGGAPHCPLCSQEPMTSGCRRPHALGGLLFVLAVIAVALPSEDVQLQVQGGDNGTSPSGAHGGGGELDRERTLRGGLALLGALAVSPLPPAAAAWRGAARSLAAELLVQGRLEAVLAEPAVAAALARELQGGGAEAGEGTPAEGVATVQRRSGQAAEARFLPPNTTQSDDRALVPGRRLGAADNSSGGVGDGAALMDAFVVASADLPAWESLRGWESGGDPCAGGGWAGVYCGGPESKCPTPVPAGRVCAISFLMKVHPHGDGSSSASGASLRFTLGPAIGRLGELAR